jgi:Fic family protein
VIYATPPLTDADRAVLADIEALREELRFYLHTPRRWYGTLRRSTFARAVQGSNSIEGYNASVEDVAAVIEDEEPLDADTETRQAISGYRDALTYVIQLAPTSLTIDASLLRSLHFMMMKYDLSRSPGQWRPAAVWVQNEHGDIVYEAPDRSDLEPLIDELLSDINGYETPPMVAAAMAHLNLTLLHPFSDGNGRMARCLQTFVLARDGVLSPEFSSIEEYLGRNTNAYYDALTSVAQGKWSPQRDARPWIEFCLTAHYRQASTLLRRIQEAEALWDRCEQAASRHGLPDRVVGAMCDAARGWRLRRSLYVKITRSASGDEISDAMATRDLAAMASAGLLEPVGQKRGRYYEPTAELRDVWAEIRTSRTTRQIADPYEHVRQPKLPGLE